MLQTTFLKMVSLQTSMIIKKIPIGINLIINNPKATNVRTIIVQTTIVQTEIAQTTIAQTTIVLKTIVHTTLLKEYCYENLKRTSCS